MASSVARDRVAAATSCLALRQSQEGDPGLRSATQPAGASVRRFGIRELSPESMELGRLVHRLAEGFIGLGESLARLPRLGGGALPCAVELTQLGAVEEALPAEMHELWLGLAPGIERRGPLLRPAQVEDLVACRDDRAVRDAHDHRRDVACGHVDHHLVHQPDATIDLAKPDECLADADLRQDEQVRIGEPPADLCGSFVRV